MDHPLLDFSADDHQAGFRLRRFDVFNWGTFHRHVWSLNPEGDNALLTGDIGSGKSTLVDGLTTLLVPGRQITYNKAAGAEGRERSLASYVRGYYKNARDEGGQSAKAVALRDEKHYSVLLAQFHNPGFEQWLTLVQVFWLKPGQNQPERWFIVAEQPLEISTHFSGFGSDIQGLKRRLRNTKGVQTFDSFAQYSAEFRRRMGIRSEQAINLLYQTVSMKSVGNLTEFVRAHMLEAPDVQERIEALIREFENLNQAHGAVLRAKQQIQALTPLVEGCDQLQQLNAQRELLRQCREALAGYWDSAKAELLGERIERRQEELERLTQQLDRGQEQLRRLRQRERDLERAIDDNGGRRLGELAQQISLLGDQRSRKQAQAERYQQLCRIQELPAELSEPQFFDTRRRLEKMQQQLEAQLGDSERRKIDLSIDKQELIKQHDSLETELDSLRRRRSNIPARMLALRAALCEATGVAESELPFAGELLQVRADASAWEGALERVLHNFGQSLLVPEILYDAVAHYVDRTHLKGRLVYFRVPQSVEPVRDWPDDGYLIHKLAIQPENPLQSWLERELALRFDYRCCDSLDAFKRYPKALTRNGQLKSGGRRFEKDDRYRLDDRSRYVLGWDNQAKIDALEAQQEGLHRRMTTLIEQLAALEKEQKALTARRDQLLELERFERFDELHWQPDAETIQRLKEEQRRIERSSDQLRELRAQLETTSEQVLTQEQQLSDKREARGKLQNKLENDQAMREQAEASTAALPATERERLFPLLEQYQAECLGEIKLSIEGCDPRQKEMREWFTSRIKNENDKAERLQAKVIARMHQFKTDFPVESREADASLEATDEYRTLLTRLENEDLPRHEARFKQMLNEGAINDIALFQNQLERERGEIEEKIRKINRSLQAIDYNAGSYITLLAEAAQDADIRQFRQDLRACLGDAFATRQDDLYTEDKFQRVKTLIDRFRGREGTAELDRRWTAKVSDVRNWFLFSVSERWRSDDTEKEHYSDAAGKSGGQKEKLAYTILASALAYQFGLEWGETRSRSFRFVMIDEAFGRGSDESARYALNLFGRLNLQLLIVTPLQKIHVIEDFVKTVNFVHNQEGRNSMVRNLTIEQYQQEKALYREEEKQRQEALPEREGNLTQAAREAPHG